MALIKCKECSSEVSSKAETCPKCGFRIKAKPMGCGSIIGIFILGAVIFSSLSSIFSDRPKKNTSTTYFKVDTAKKAEAANAPTTKTLGSQWRYSNSEDEMSKGFTHEASVTSSNTVNFEFPYSGEQHGTLILRTHPRNGKDIIFEIEKGQILCHSYQNCTVLIRFDDEQSVSYSASEATDNSTETIFIGNYREFVGKMLKAKTVRIAPNIHQEGSPVFEFDVSGFDEAQYKSNK